MIHLVGTVLGTLVTGVIIEGATLTVGFLFAAVMSVLLMVSVGFLRGGSLPNRPQERAGYLSDVAGGLQIFLQNRTARMLTILTIVSLPVGQLSNAILSSFVRDDLGLGSDAFGFVDAGWPVGGMLAAGALSLGLRHLQAPIMVYILAISAGVFTVLLSMISSVPLLALVHAAMGFSVWMCRILIDGRILAACEAENVGRTKVYVEVLFSLSALIMCLSPTLVKLPMTSDYFLYWGLFITAASSLVWLWQGRVSEKA